MSGRRMRELARQRKHGMTTCELAAAYHVKRERVAMVVAQWAEMRRETSPQRREGKA